MVAGDTDWTDTDVGEEVEREGAISFMVVNAVMRATLMVRVGGR